MSARALNARLFRKQLAARQEALDWASDAQMGEHKPAWTTPGLHREYVMDDLRVPRAPYDQYRAKVVEGLKGKGMSHEDAEDLIYDGHDFGGIWEDHYSGLSVKGSIENHLNSRW